MKNLKEILNANLNEDLGFKNLPDAKREEILINISNLIFQGLVIGCLKEMNETVKEELERLLDVKDGNPEEIFDFLEKNCENYNNILTEEIYKIKKEAIDILS